MSGREKGKEEDRLVLLMMGRDDRSTLDVPQSVRYLVGR